MIGRKTKRHKKDEGEENGLFQSDTLLEYQNKSLCTLVNDLREKLKAKEEALATNIIIIVDISSMAHPPKSKNIL